MIPFLIKLKEFVTIMGVILFVSKYLKFFNTFSRPSLKVTSDMYLTPFIPPKTTKKFTILRVRYSVIEYNV